MYVRGHLMMVIPLYVLSVRYFSDAIAVLLSPYLAVYCLLSMIGSLFPDVDWTIMKLYRRFGHRNPLTHSSLFPFILFALISYYKAYYPAMLASCNAFIFGVSTHLFGDMVKTGNLVWVRSRKYENSWYILNGVVVVLLLYLNGFFKPSQLMG